VDVWGLDELQANELGVGIVGSGRVQGVAGCDAPAKSGAASMQ
jgi:hypothetical protein